MLYALGLLCLKSILLCVKGDCSGEFLVSNQSEIDQFMKTPQFYNNPSNNPVCIHFLLNPGNAYKVDMMKMMFLATNGSLIMKSNGGPVEIHCTAGSSDLAGEAVNQIIQPLSRAPLVLLDGLVFTGCPVPILIEEASNVVIQDCVFR